MTKRKHDEDTIVISSDEDTSDVEIFEEDHLVVSSQDKIKQEDDSTMYHQDQATSSDVQMKEQCEDDVSHLFKGSEQRLESLPQVR